MSEEKIRVKDITTELGVSNKDMLTALRELSIPAKSHMATLTADDVTRVKEHFAAAPAGDADKERRETQSGVIVRRRRRDPENAPEEAAAPAAVAAPADTPKTESRPERSAAAPELKAPARKKAAATAVATAVAEDAPEATPVLKADGEKAAKAEKVTAEAAAEAQPVATEKPAKAKAPKEPEQKARIIRRADEAAPAPQKKAEPVPAAVAAPAATEAPATAGAASAAAPSGAPKADDGAAQEKAPARPPRAARANISAEPERGKDGAAVSSVPVLAPRSERDDRGDDERGEQASPSSQVRIISRPVPGQTPSGPSSDARPAGQRPGGPGGPRSGGPGGPGGPRPGGPGGPRPGGPGGPGRPFAPRPAAAAAGPAPESDASRNKKRQKTRRTVDFDSSGGDDFSKRRREMDGGDEGAWRGKGGKRRGKGREAARASTVTQPLKAAKRKIRVDELIRVSDLAHQMGLKATEIIKVLFGLGVMATINQTLDVDTTTLVAAEFDYEVEKVGFSEEEYTEEQLADAPENMRPRPPVVTIMGHVDHGKTSLLDAIRKSSVASGEAGGITQHIGAYNVKTKKGQIVFLDTPGHEAFTAMRARGAEITDIVVLVVAADDGVMEQTREAISHAKAAGVPIMVAVNKMDKEEANPDRVKRELAEQGLVAEDWGGDTNFSYVSAKSLAGVDDLLEMVALQAEILELKANPDKPARGHIIEAKLDKGRGALGTVLIQQGTLKVGDAFVCGSLFGRVRAMFDDQGKKLKSAGPSMPVEVQGFEGVPEAGEEFICIADEKAARRIADNRAVKQREKALAKESRVTLETFLSRKPDAVEALVLNLVVKADVQGSIEAITDALNKLSTEKVRIHVIHTGAGAISESDVLLASASDAIIIGFNVRPTPKAKELIAQEKIDIRFYDIIYKLVEEVKNAMEGMLAPVEKEVYLGLAEVRETFSVPKVGVIAGCMVSDGKILRNAQVRLLRDNVVIYTGKISSLKRFKDDAREVLKGYECGIGLERFNDIKVGDNIEAFEMIEEAASL
ncbi:Translation initiation factor IF-2 [uncultured delta proteobacterium]|uniref:Translation initiation factor IF-2 n=1 Tax=uncultured delta proteobacterium TaxID=34034 RepID=A0A212JGB5_9DELT|nr:Translation initiation factor IF-2 [uncultured delta proteobacterium]